MTYSGLNKKLKELGGQIGVPDNLYPDLKNSRDGGFLHIEIAFPFYFLVVIEGGRELERKKFISIDDLLYEVFRRITLDMAMHYEVNHRIEGQDFRRNMFAYQIRLIETLSKSWGNKLRSEIHSILLQNPYNDAL